ncbi:hypothetical protein SOV_05200 [Sporomusa ovata DSM 2662]|uniref:Uncharacterized protein n=1 Tax=Sporomusa ovata TaxID=2378 RepID=A0A0U1KWA7_9FIRM|nr:CBO0543 family protein [Sporomusa ovata]EQB28188.1 hypothetical protein SOV_2c11110 [Sporomusa ovata DSM 2662]CQR71718.1 hypothetical protein SpAn4DRAFT_3584 [Sporomusa ovata]
MNILEALHASRAETWNIKTALWQQAFLGPNWWFIAIIIAVSYAIWWKFIDKKRVIEILLFGSFIAVSRVIFDNWGTSTVKWTYVIDLLPIGISLFLNDLTIVPLAYMLAYQYSPTWKKYLVTIFIIQGITSFAFLPLLIRMGILSIINWHVGYSFIFMIITATIMRAILLFGLSIQKSTRLEYTGNTTEFIPQPAMKPFDKEGEKKKPS